MSLHRSHRLTDSGSNRGVSMHDPSLLPSSLARDDSSMPPKFRIVWHGTALGPGGFNRVHELLGPTSANQAQCSQTGPQTSKHHPGVKHTIDWVRGSDSAPRNDFPALEYFCICS